MEWRARELFPYVGFIVTNLNRQARNVVRFYIGRGTAEQWIKASPQPRGNQRCSLPHRG